MTMLSDEQQVPNMDYGEVISDVAESAGAAAYIRQRFEDARRHRTNHEVRWMNAWNQFRGRYSPQEQHLLARIKETNPFASEAFIKITKTKTLAAYGSIMEILTYGNQFPLDIKPTPVPEGVAEKVYVDKTEDPDSIQVLADAIGYAGDGKDLAKGATARSLLAGTFDKLGSLMDGKFLKSGDSPDKINSPEFRPADMAAKKMSDQIQDQLMEQHAQREMENMAWEMALFGTGVIKGPFTHKVMSSKWVFNEEQKAEFDPSFKLTPKISSPTVWNVYPDPYAKVNGELEFVVERHKLTKYEIQKLKSQPNFDSELIDIALRSSPSIDEEEWESQLRDSAEGIEDNRYEVLEYWGVVDASEARRFGIKNVPDSLEDFEQVHVNMWSIGGYAVKKVINPFIPERVPYLFVPYEAHKFQLWGIGVPENMEDAQRMINVHTRAAQDNLRLAGSVMLEVNENQLAPGQDNSIYAGKVWRKQGGAPGQSIYSISFNNTAPQHLQFIGEANRWADQASGIPSVLHGQTGVTGTGRTATTMSMIMNSGNLAIRTVTKNIDRYIITPLGEAYFNWNMQFNDTAPEIIGDVNIVAGATSALAQREVQSQRILTFLQVTANPVDAPFANRRYLIQELAKSLDLDPDDAVNDIEMTKLLMESMNNGQNTGAGTPPSDDGGNMGSPESGPPTPPQPNGQGAGPGGIGISPPTTG